MPFSQSDIALDSFASRVLIWFTQQGRHDLPWQQHHIDTPDPYQVWLSEVMLQQTQVATVIPYFQKFMLSFPTVQQLATADWETVASHWAGLGYYARARNLHKGAKQLTQIIKETGSFPKTVEEWQQISGVGRSTAGAIVAMGMRNFGVICDGNVKRVLTRWAGIDGDINKSATDKQLWQLAERLTPQQNSGEYAQAMMDMGATLCTKSKPACLLCPIQQDCIAHAQGQETAYPVKSKKSPNPEKHSFALQLINPEHKILWLQRPDNGIWGGLYCLPLQFQQKILEKKVLATFTDDIIFQAEYTTAEQIIFEIFHHDIIEKFNKQQVIKHSLTHFHWYLMPITLQLTMEQTHLLHQKLIQAGQKFGWYLIDEVKDLAIPKAMQKLLSS